MDKKSRNSLWRKKIYENPGEPKKFKAHRVILGKRRRINLEVIKELIDEGVNIHTENDYVLKYTSRYGYLSVVKYLVEHGTNINIDNDESLIYASTNGHLNIVKYLIEHEADIHAKNYEALKQALKNEHLNV